MKRRHDDPPLKKRALTDADTWREELNTRCAKAIATWLRAGINVQRPISTLTLAELRHIASAATDEWIVAQSQRLASEPVPTEFVEHDLLFGG